MPFIGETERHKFGLLRPDTPIRDARHHLRHIVNCGERTILIDPSIEKSSPLASPVEELLHMCKDPFPSRELMMIIPDLGIKDRLMVDE